VAVSALTDIPDGIWQEALPEGIDRATAGGGTSVAMRLWRDPAVAAYHGARHYASSALFPEQAWSVLRSKAERDTGNVACPKWQSCLLRYFNRLRDP
jgi:hypothetical protein